MAQNATLDHARLAASFGIVLFHSGAPGAAIGYAALPFFLIVMLMFGAHSAARLPFRVYAKSRATRLLRPWLLWSGIYAMVKLVDALIAGSPLRSEFAPWMLLTGPALHLWFLPFAFAATLLLPPALRIGGAIGHGPAMVLCCVAALAALWLNQGGVLPPPLGQWRFALPAVCVGLGLALASGRRGGLAVMAATGTALVLGATVLGWTDGREQIALALLALGLCLALPLRATPLSAMAARCALGVYLAHPLVMALLLRATPLPEASLALAAATALGSLGLSLAITCLPPVWRQHRRGHAVAPAPN